MLAAELINGWMQEGLPAEALKTVVGPWSSWIWPFFLGGAVLRMSEYVLRRLRGGVE